MTYKLKYFIPAAAVLALLFVATIAFAEVNFAEQTPQESYQTFNFFQGGGSSLSATTTSATSTNITGGGGYFKIAGANNVELYFSRGDTTGQGNSGSSLFRIQVTPDGTNWHEYNDLRLNAVTPGNVFMGRVGTSSIAAATSTVIAHMESLGFYGIRCIVVEATDGEHTCKASADF